MRLWRSDQVNTSIRPPGGAADIAYYTASASICRVKHQIPRGNEIFRDSGQTNAHVPILVGVHPLGASHLKLIELLLDLRTEINAKSKEQGTALHIAVKAR